MKAYRLKRIFFIFLAAALAAPLLSAPAGGEDAFYNPPPDGSPPAPSQPESVQVGEQPRIIKNVSVLKKIESQLQVECSFEVEYPHPGISKFKKLALSTLALSNSEEICQALEFVRETDLKVTLHIIKQENLGFPAFWVHKVINQFQYPPPENPPLPDGDYGIGKHFSIGVMTELPIDALCARFGIIHNFDTFPVLLGNDPAICARLEFAYLSHQRVTIFTTPAKFQTDGEPQLGLWVHKVDFE